MNLIVEFTNCLDCPAMHPSEITDELPFCNLILNGVINAGEKDYSSAYLRVFPHIPKNCPILLANSSPENALIVRAADLW